MKKRAMSSVVTNVLIILLVVVLIGLISVIVFKMLGFAKTGIESKTLDIKYNSGYGVKLTIIQNSFLVDPYIRKANVLVRAETNGEEINAVLVRMKDSQENIANQRVEKNIENFQTVRLEDLDYSNLLTEPNQICVAPIGIKDNIEVLGKENCINVIINLSESIIPLSIANQYIYEGENLKISLASLFSNSGTTYNISNMPNGATFDNARYIFNWTPNYDQFGFYNITFTIITPKNTIYQSLFINVLNKAEVIPWENSVYFNPYNSNISYEPFTNRMIFKKSEIWKINTNDNSNINIFDISGKKVYSGPAGITNPVNVVGHYFVESKADRSEFLITPDDYTNISFYGTSGGPVWKSGFTFVYDSTKAMKLGMVRGYAAGWDEIYNYQTGEYNWTIADQRMAVLTEFPLIMTVYGDINQSEVPENKIYGEFIKFSNATLQRYLKKYPDKIKFIEVLNEPYANGVVNDLILFYQIKNDTNNGTLPYSEAYRIHTNITKDINEIVKSINPNVKVVGGAFQGLVLKDLKGISDAGIGSYVDGISWHEYRLGYFWPDEEPDVDLYGDLYEEMDGQIDEIKKMFPNKTLIVDEIGVTGLSAIGVPYSKEISGCGENSILAGTWRTDNWHEGMSKMIKTIVMMKSSGVDYIMPHINNLYNPNCAWVGYESGSIDSKGIKPQNSAMLMVSYLLSKSTFVKKIKFGNEIYAYEYKMNDGKSFVIAWTKSGQVIRFNKINNIKTTNIFKEDIKTNVLTEEPIVFWSNDITSLLGDINQSVQKVCGNGIVDYGEECEGYNLNGNTCISKGYGSGILSCNACKFDYSSCERYDFPIDKLTAMWDFETGSGNYLIDSKNNNIGNLKNFECLGLDCNNESGWTTQGKVGKGIKFDGLDDYIIINSSIGRYGESSNSIALAGPQLIANGSFEKGTGGWIIGANSIRSTESSFNQEFIGTGEFGSSYSLKSTGNDASTYKLDNVNYSISARVFVNISQYTDGEVALQLLDRYGSVLESFSANTSVKGVFQMLYFYYNGQKADSIRLRNSANAIVNWDGVSANGAYSYTISLWYKTPIEVCPNNCLENGTILSYSKFDVLGRIGPRIVAPAYQNRTFMVISTNDYSVISKPSNLTGYHSSYVKTGNGNTWHNLIYIVDRENKIIRVYLDGKMVDNNTKANEPLTLVPWSSTNPTVDKLCLGGGFDYFGCNVKKFTGTLDELYIWNKALDQKEVNGVYENQK